MARPTQQHPGPTAGTPAPAAADGSGPADVIELILADHRRIRRLREALHDTVRLGGEPGPAWVLAHVWQRLAGLLEVHTRAEEEICFLPMSGPGPEAARRKRDAVADHEDIRAAVSEASLQPVGSAAWWRAAGAALAASAEHFEREERGVLACCSLTPDQRLELGRQWTAFVAAHRRDITVGSSGGARSGRARAAANSVPTARASPAPGLAAPPRLRPRGRQPPARSRWPAGPVTTGNINRATIFIDGHKPGTALES